MSRALLVNRLLCAILFMVAGTLHFLLPNAYASIMPAYLPAPALLVAVSGAAEVLGGVGLLLRPTRRAAGLGLMVLLLAVLPANIEMLRLVRATNNHAWWVEVLAWLRLPLQAALMVWVERVSRTTHRPATGCTPGY